MKLILDDGSIIEMPFGGRMLGLKVASVVMCAHDFVEMQKQLNSESRSERELTSNYIDSIILKMPPLHIDDKPKSMFVDINNPPESIEDWMRLHEMPAKMYVCRTHHEWFIEVGHHFPYYSSSNKCPKCI